MKKRILMLLLALPAVLMLAGCREEPRETEPPYSIPTPPSISESKTPLEQLSEAFEKTKTLISATVQYGKDGETGKNEYSQKVSAQSAFDLEILYTQVPDFPTNPGLLADFCGFPLEAVPSNDGTVRYAVRDLTGEELGRLLYGEDPGLKSGGTVSITVDAQGCLSRGECATEDGTTWFIALKDMVLPER